GVDDPLRRLELRGLAYIEFGLAHPEHYRILMMGKVPIPDDFPSEDLAGTITFQHLLDDVTGALGAAARGDHPLVVACSIWVAVHGLTALLIAHPQFPWPDRDALIEHVVRMALATMRPAAAQQA